MKDHWKEKRLEDVVFLQEGPGIRSYEYAVDGYPIINVRCVQNGYIDLSKGKKADNALATGKWSHFQIEKGDILFTISGTIGRVAVVQEKDLPLLMNTSVVRFRSIDSGLRNDYFYYYLQSSDFLDELKSRATGTAILNVGPSHLKSMAVPIPPLPEQKRIVAILDEVIEGIDSAIANAEKNLLNARELFESYLNEVFAENGKNWDRERLSKAFKIRPPKAESKENLNDSDMVSFVPMSDLNESDKHFELQQERPLGKVYAGYTYFADGDVLLAKITPCFENGKLGIARNLTNGVGFGSSEYIVFRPTGVATSEYLYYYLAQESFRKIGHKLMTGAVGHKRVPKEFIAEHQIPIPSLQEQNRIVRQLDQLSIEIHRLGAIYQRKLTNFVELKQSILQKAFSGELTKKAA